MNDLPWLKWYPADWMKDTRLLSMTAKGGWIDILGALHNARPIGSLALSVEQWARIMACDETTAGNVLRELGQTQIAEVVTLGNNSVMVKSRRMLREGKLREQNRQRVYKHRDEHGRYDHVTPRKRSGNGPGNGVVMNRGLEARGQRLELIPKNPASPKEKIHAPNPLLEAIALAVHGTLAGLTRSAWSGCQKALTEIKEATPDVTPTEIARRWANYQKLGHKGSPSAQALAKWWSICGNDASCSAHTNGHAVNQDAERAAIARAQRNQQELL